MATVVGLFDNRDTAQSAIEQLRASGIESGRISVAMQSREETQAIADDAGVGGGAVTGAIGGGVLGGLAGLLVGIGALAIPVVGPIVAAGPLAAALIGAGIGAAAGGLVGALVDAGVPEEEARLYETGVQHGGVLVTANVAEEQAGSARDILNRNGARDIRADQANLSNPDFQYGTGIYPNANPVTGYVTPVTPMGVGYDAGGTVTNFAADEVMLDETPSTAATMGTTSDYSTTGDYRDMDPNAPRDFRTSAEADMRGADIDRTRTGDDRGFGAEAVGGGAGAVTGGVIGAAVGGPIGAVAGAAIGGAAGAGAADAAKGGEVGDQVGSQTGGATGAVVGGAIGAVGGPVGAAAGAAIGGAVGAGTGKEVSDVASDAADDNIDNTDYTNRDLDNRGYNRADNPPL